MLGFYPSLVRTRDVQEWAWTALGSGMSLADAQAKLEQQAGSSSSGAPDLASLEQQLADALASHARCKQEHKLLKE